MLLVFLIFEVVQFPQSFRIHGEDVGWCSVPCCLVRIDHRQRTRHRPYEGYLTFSASTNHYIILKVWVSLDGDNVDCLMGHPHRNCSVENLIGDEEYTHETDATSSYPGFPDTENGHQGFPLSV